MSRFFVFILVCCILIVFSGCKSNSPVFEPEPELRGGSLRDTVLYYPTDDGFVIPVMRQIPWEEGIACAALSYLIDTEANRAEAQRCGLNTVIPDSTRFSLKIGENKNANLDVQNMPKLSDAQSEQIFLQTVVNTLTEFDTIETVSLTFDGEVKDKMSNGTRVDEKMREFLLNAQQIDMETMASGEMNSVSLYVPDSTCMYNLPITGYVRGNRNFETAMKLFCKHSALHNNGLPSGTDIVSAKIENGVATVHFSEEFARLQSTGVGVLEAMYKAIYLTANEFESINDLEIYAGAEQLDCGAFSVSAPLYVNTWQ